MGSALTMRNGAWLRGGVRRRDLTHTGRYELSYQEVSNEFRAAITSVPLRVIGPWPLPTG